MTTDKKRSRAHAFTIGDDMPKPPLDGERPSKASQSTSALSDGLTQSERFIKAAQELGTDDDPERFAERVRKLTSGDKKKI